MRLTYLSILFAVYCSGQRGPAPPDGMRFRFMGPAVGNRISAAVGIPGDPTTYYIGGASGGVWKSTDSGVRWNPIFDSQPVQAIGSLAVARSNSKIVWAGTGEAWAIRDVDMMGNGVYRSTDAGQTWTHMGLDETGRIGRIVIHPKDPETVYVCALGRLTGPQEERGVYRTSDGGKNWTRVLFADAGTGCSGLAMDPNDPNVLFAGMWQVEMHTYGMYSGGPSSALYVSRDAGTTWKKLSGNGLPKSPVGKIDVAVAAKNSKRVYALIQTADQGSLWRSDDGGENWAVTSWARALIGRAGYYIRLAVSPANPDEVLVANSSFHLSTDGGKTFNIVNWGGDTHDIWIDPLDGNRIMVSHDVGLYMTTDHGKTSNRVTLPVGQIYHVAVDNDVPYKIYGNMQDSSSTMRGPSNQPDIGPNVPGQSSGGFGGGGGGRGGVSAWERNLGGCESGFTIPDPTNTDIIWATCYGDEVTRYDAKTKIVRSVSPWLHTLDSPPNDAKYRCHWTAPLAIDPFDHNSVYFGCQVIFKTTNGGNSWNVISPDLSTQDPKYIAPSGGIVGDNLGQFYGEVVFSIAPSEVQKGLIWAGTNDGKLWYTSDGGTNWNDVGKNIPGVPPMGTFTKIEPSHFDAGTAYVAVDLHLMDNRDPFLYKTTDFGKTWTKISDGLPKGPLGYARIITENPNRKGMLFAGTGNGFYYSMNDGGTWKQFKDGLPAAPVSWIVVQKQAHDVVVSTYGRGMYILENITPLEQDAAGTEVTNQLIAPRTVDRMLQRGRALIDFTLKTASKDPVGIDIVDEKGVVIRHLTAPGKAGLNRVAWDLHYETPRLVALRTTPPENPHIWEEPRFKGKDTRSITHWGLAQAEVGPIAAPGKYTVRLTVPGETSRMEQPLEIVKMPGSHGTDDDLKASVRLQAKVRDDISAASDMVNQIEWMRKQLEDQKKKAKQPVLAAMEEIDRKMQEVEYQLITRADALSDDKYFSSAYKLYMNFIWMNGEIGTGAGDVAGSGDYGPTETSLGLVLGLEKQLQGVQDAYKTLMERDVPAYNAAISNRGIVALKTTGAPAPPPPVRGFGGGDDDEDPNN